MDVMTKLKRWETWDRAFVLLKLAGWGYAVIQLAVRMPEMEPIPSDFVVFLTLSTTFFLAIEAYSLRAIWLHRVPGFVIQVVLELLVIGMWLMKLTSWDVWTWTHTLVILLYCGFRAYQLKFIPPLSKV